MFLKHVKWSAETGQIDFLQYTVGVQVDRFPGVYNVSTQKINEDVMFQNKDNKSTSEVLKSDQIKKKKKKKKKKSHAV